MKNNAVYYTNIILYIHFMFTKVLKYFSSYFRQVCQFLMRNANQHALDEDGKNPLSIALSREDADIVTL